MIDLLVATRDHCFGVPDIIVRCHHWICSVLCETSLGCHPQLDFNSSHTRNVFCDFPFFVGGLQALLQRSGVSVAPIQVVPRLLARGVLSCRAARRCDWWQRQWRSAGQVRWPGPLPRRTGVIASDAERHSHVLYAWQVKGDPAALVFCSRCGALLNRLFSACHSYRVCPAEDRLPHIYGGKHPTRADILDGVSRLLSSRMSDARCCSGIGEAVCCSRRGVSVGAARDVRFCWSWLRLLVSMTPRILLSTSWEILWRGSIRGTMTRHGYGCWLPHCQERPWFAHNRRRRHVGLYTARSWVGPHTPCFRCCATLCCGPHGPPSVTTALTRVDWCQTHSYRCTQQIHMCLNTAGELSNPKMCLHLSLSPSKDDHCRCSCLAT